MERESPRVIGLLVGDSKAKGNRAFSSPLFVIISSSPLTMCVSLLPLLHPPHCPPTIFRWRACFLHSESGCLSPPATRLQIKSNEGESSMMGHGSSFHHPHVSPQKSNFLLLTPGNYSSSLILFHVSFFFVDGLHSLFFLLIYFNKKHFFF